MRFDVTGQPGAPAVLLSAGLGGVASFWAPQMAALQARYRVVTYDQRGTGDNRAPLPTPYSIAAMADDVLEIMDAAGLARCHLVGHALGGLVGLDLALRAPHRVASLVPVNAWARLDVHTRHCFAVRLDLLRHAGPAAYVRAQPLFLYPAPWLSAHADRVAHEVAHGIAHFQGTANLLARIDALQAFDVADRLHQVRCPVLVAASRDDMLVPWTASQALADGIPGARLRVVPDGGHGFTTTEPQAFDAALLEFLDAQA